MRFAIPGVRTLRTSGQGGVSLHQGWTIDKRAEKNPPSFLVCRNEGGFEKIPAMTDFRAKGTIMGPAGLTAVFGMGTGVTPPVWSPEIRTLNRQAERPGESGGRVTSRAGQATENQASRVVFKSLRDRPSYDPVESGGWSRHWDRWETCLHRATSRSVLTGDGSGWSSDRLLELVRCGGRPPCTSSPSTWWSSRSLHSLR